MRGVFSADLSVRPCSFMWAIVSILFFLKPEIVSAQLNASFLANRTQGCAPLVVVFTNTSTGSPESCEWSFGNGNESAECSPLATYTQPGVYEVILTIRRGSEVSTATRTVTVFRDPVANFDLSIDKGCFPLPVSFSDRSLATDAPITAWTWNFGDGRSSSQQNPVNTYLSSGIFDVTLIVTDANGCRNTVFKEDTIAVVRRPTAAFIFSDSIACSIPFTTQFTDASQSVQPLTYQWSFGDGATSAERNPAHTYNDIGNFPVRLEVENQFGCKDDTVISGRIRIEDLQANIVMDSLGCAPFTVDFDADVNVPVRAYTWTFFSGMTSSQKSGSVTFTNPGVYEVSLLVVSQSNCSTSVKKTIRVGTSPVADFSALPQTACRAPLTVQFTNQSTGASAFRWVFGSGGAFSTLENPVFTYNLPGRYDVDLQVRSPEGCTARKLVRDFIIIEQPQLAINATNPGGCAPLTTSFSIDQTGPGTIASVVWNFGNGNTFTGLNPPPQTYSTIGSYTVTAAVTFADGCNPRNLTRVVTAGDIQNFSATLQPRELCANRSVTGSATGGAGNTQFIWDMGNGETVVGRNINYVYRTPGTFVVRVTGSSLGCQVTQNLGQVVVNPPNAAFSISTLCGGKTVTFTNRSEGRTSSVWDFGDGSPVVSNNAFSVQHTFPSYGVYSVKLLVSNSATGCVDSIIRQIDLRDDRPRVVLNEQKGCSPLLATFADTNSVWRTLTWDLGDTILPRRTATFTFTEPGAYDIKVYTLDQQGCRDTFLFKDLIKVVKPEAGFAFNPLGGCAPITVNFTDTSKSAFSNVTSWQWDFAGLGNSTQRNPVFSFALTDTVPITLIVRDNLGCRDTVTNEIPVSFPKAIVTADFNSICTGTPYQFQNESFGVALKYTWNFGDGSPVSNERSPAHIYSAEGVYDVSLLIEDDNNCRDSIFLPGFIKVENFTYDFDADQKFKTCPELISNFSISPLNIFYNEAFWDFGNGNLSTDSSRFPTNIYNEAGLYTVSLVLEDFRGCRDTIIKPDFIRIEGPRGSFTVTPDSGCAPLSVSIQADFFGSKTNFWDFGDGVGLVDTNLVTTIQHTYQTPGRSRPSLVIDDGEGCVVIVRGPEVRVSNVIAQILPSATLACNEEEIVFADTGRSRTFSPVVDWQWDFGDGNTGSGQQVTHSFQTEVTGNYTVILTSTNSFGCIGRDSIDVTVYKNPPLQTDGDKIICKGDAVQLNASGVANYEWFPKTDVMNPFSPSPEVAPFEDREYVVLGFDIPGCPAYDTVWVRVVDKVMASAWPDTALCVGASVQLFSEASLINSGVMRFFWEPSEGLSDPSIANPVASPESDVMYVVNVSNGNCVPARVPVFVNVNPSPSLRTGGDQQIFKDQSVRLESFSGNDVTYRWTPSEGLDCVDCPFPVASPGVSTTYTITATNTFDCSVSKDVLVEVIELCDNAVLQIPNTFSPNDDGLNDQFMLRGSGIKGLKSMRIYSRTGQMVFESFDINQGWDGMFNGVRLNSGVYVYILEAVCDNGDVTVAKGNITLLR